ncbi:ABC transporter substrate-binding protein [Actinomadura yumaensis]|uniref:ABC transporter substrate-binding protein n=1 Tax=Actinomadura yumaensis TaxID=111807 RepID=UPI003609BEB8
MPEVAPLRAGDPDRLGPYRLTGLLGQGGQGAVYLAEVEPGGPLDAGPEQRVAVKLLHARFSGDPKARSRFAAELDVARRVAPFCTARILDADVEGDRPYIVSEYIDGPSLSAVLAEAGPRHGAELDRIAIGTMTALAAIHQAGVVHRDFKPANVLLAADGPRVIDFGIARALDATGTLSSTAVGTPAYMAPEQISGAPVGPEADVFAWGATMVYAAGTRPAFGQDSIPAVMHRILNLPPDLGALFEPLRSLVADCLSKDPNLRPSSHQVLVRLLSLAGSLPGAAGGGNGARDAAVLNQGAEAAATSTRLRQVIAPPQGFPGQPPAPGPPGGPHPSLPAPAPPPTPWARPSPDVQAPAASTWPPQDAPASAGSNWPSQDTAPGSPQTTRPPDASRPPSASRPRRGPRVGVLAGAGSAALVALVVLGSVIAVQLRESDGKDPAPAPGRVGGELRTVFQTVGESGELDPSHSLLGTRKFISKQLFTGLVETAPDGSARYRLATSITPDATCTRWTIALKTGTRFSDGEPVDAESFARGWARAAAVPGSAAPYLMNDIKGFPEVSGAKKAESLSGVQASGGTLRVELTSPNCEFAARLGDPVFSPVPRKAGRADNAAYNLNPVGNGPFKIQASQKDRALTLVRNEAWAFGKTKLDRVLLKLSDDTTAIGRAGAAAGEVDWAPIEQDGLVSARSRRGLITHSTPFSRMLVPLTARGPMKSREARQAVSYALDRTAISNALYGGVYQPAHGIVPAGIPGFGAAGRCASCDASDQVKARTSPRGPGSGPRPSSISTSKTPTRTAGWARSCGTACGRCSGGRSS